MTYKLANGEMEGDYLGFLQFADTIDPQTATESYLVEGGPTILAPTISTYIRRQQGVETGEEPRITLTPGPGATLAAVGGVLLLLILGSRR